jgi:hypothetical protein
VTVQHSAPRRAARSLTSQLFDDQTSHGQAAPQIAPPSAPQAATTSMPSLLDSMAAPSLAPALTQSFTPAAAFGGLQLASAAPFSMLPQQQFGMGTVSPLLGGMAALGATQASFADPLSPTARHLLMMAEAAPPELKLKQSQAMLVGLANFLHVLSTAEWAGSRVRAFVEKALSIQLPQLTQGLVVAPAVWDAVASAQAKAAPCERCGAQDGGSHFPECPQYYHTVDKVTNADGTVSKRPLCKGYSPLCSGCKEPVVPKQGRGRNGRGQAQQSFQSGYGFHAGPAQPYMQQPTYLQHAAPAVHPPQAWAAPYMAGYAAPQPMAPSPQPLAAPQPPPQQQ